MEQEIRATVGQVAKTGGAYPPETLPNLATPVSSLLQLSPAARLRSTATAGAEAQGGFQMIPSSWPEGVGGGERDLWVRSASPAPPA